MGKTKYPAWKKVINYLAEVGSEREVHDLCWKAIRSLQRLVPFDSASLQMTNERREILPESRAYLMDEKWFSAYKEYFKYIDPGRANFPRGITIAAVPWKPHRNMEIVSDFLLPGDVTGTGGIFLYDHRHELFAMFNLNRSGSGMFREEELDVMQAVQAPLSNLVACLTTPRQPDLDVYHLREMAAGCRLLSRREAEVACLLCNRLSAAQIGTRLLISKRTAEQHIRNIYEKLDVHSRRELVIQLMRMDGASRAAVRDVMGGISYAASVSAGSGASIISS